MQKSLTEPFHIRAGRCTRLMVTPLPVCRMMPQRKAAKAACLSLSHKPEAVSHGEMKYFSHPEEA